MSQKVKILVLATKAISVTVHSLYNSLYCHSLFCSILQIIYVVATLFSFTSVIFYISLCSLFFQVPKYFIDFTLFISCTIHTRLINQSATLIMHSTIYAMTALLVVHSCCTVHSTIILNFFFFSTKWHYVSCMLKVTHVCMSIQHINRTICHHLPDKGKTTGKNIYRHVL